MDAAEILMAEHGVDGATIRAMVGMAGANTAAIHYHFKSREGLIEAMIGRHGGSVSRRRSEMIAEFDRTNSASTPMDIVNILVDPFFELLEQKGEAGRRFLRFIARLQFDRKNQSNNTGLQVHEERKYYPEIRVRLSDMIGEACPEVSKVEQEQRLTMALDTMLQSLANAEFMSTEWETDERYDELLCYTANLKTFLEAGLAAPATQQKTKPKRWR
ncbi:MAG: TetR/AcrR family transcriptional regulator [Candidatus Hydrogenedentota bacterium]